MGSLKLLRSNLEVNFEECPDLNEGKRYPSESVIYSALDSNDYSALDNVVVIPSINPSVPDILFSEDVWHNSVCIKRANETKRRVSFETINNIALRQEAKIVCASVIWWLGGFTAKISSLIRKCENIVFCYRIIDKMNCNSLFWLNRPPICQLFIDELKEGKTDRTLKNYLSDISSLCDFNETSLAKFGYKFDVNLRYKYLPKSVKGSNQTYAMPYRIMMSVWNELEKRINNYKSELDLCDLKDLIAIITEFNNSDFNTGKRSHAFMMFLRDKKQKELSAILARGGLFARNAIYMSNQKRFKNCLGLDSQLIAKTYNKIALDVSNCIQAMSGMRLNEVKGLYHSSLSINDGIVILKVYLQKWAVDGGQLEEWVAADFAAEAFDLLVSLNTSILNMTRDEIANVPLVFNIASWLKNGKIELMADQRRFEWSDQLVESIGLIMTDEDFQEFKELNPNIERPEVVFEEIAVGQYWPLRTHQHRRSIAVHTKRLNLASSNARNWQFKQLTMSITEWYEAHKSKETLPKDFIKELIQADLDFSASLALRFQNGTNLIGTGGEELMKQKDQAESLKTFPSYKVAISMAKRKSAKVMSLGNGFYCMNGFNCDFKPVIQSASCNPKCPSMVADEKSIPIWKERHVHYSELLLEAESKGESQANIDYLKLELEFYEDALRFYGELGHVN
jgi:hypothetical protein